MINCIICNSICPPLPKLLIARYKQRKYCSSKCIKKAYALRHPEKNKQQKQKWLINNPEKRKEVSNNYRLRNQEYYREYSSLRTRYTLQSKPKWLNEFEQFWILELYHLAKLRGKEVDHIIPIKHNRVCGLHVPWNMQFLTREENAKKNNKFDEDVCGVVVEDVVGVVNG